MVKSAQMKRVIVTLFTFVNPPIDWVLMDICQTFGGEIEESCLLVCHFCLPKEKSDIYIGTLGPPCCLRLSWRLRPPRHLGASPAEPSRTSEYNQHV